MLNDVGFLKISRMAIAGQAMPIRRIGFGFKVEHPLNFLILASAKKKNYFIVARI
jgi:hypothetical protein